MGGDGSGLRLFDSYKPPISGFADLALVDEEGDLSETADLAKFKDVSLFDEFDQVGDKSHLRLKPSYTPSRQNPYLLNPLPRRLGKINHRFKTRYFFLWFLLYNIYVRVFTPSTPPEGAWLCLV